MIFTGDNFAPLKNRFQTLELAGAKRAVQFGDSIVVAQLFVLTPIAGFGAALIAKFPGEHGKVRIICDDHSTFAGGNLFIGIEAKDARVSERSHFAAVELRAKGFASILDDEELVTPGNLEDFVECRGTAEGVHHDDCTSAQGDGFFDPGRIEIQRLGIDVNEDRHGALVKKNIGDGDESKRRDDDFIAFGDAQSAYTEMEGAGSGIHGDGIRSAAVTGDGLLELFHLGAEAQAGGAENCADGGDVRFGDIGGGERNSHRGRFHGLAGPGRGEDAWRFIKSSWEIGTVVKTWTIFSEAKPSP